MAARTRGRSAMPRQTEREAHRQFRRDCVTGWTPSPPASDVSPRDWARSRQAQGLIHMREFAFMHHEIIRAIDPPLRLKIVLARWNCMAMKLTESSRKPSAQLSRYSRVESDGI